MPFVISVTQYMEMMQVVYPEAVFGWLAQLVAFRCFVEVVIFRSLRILDAVYVDDSWSALYVENPVF